MSEPCRITQKAVTIPLPLGTQVWLLYVDDHLEGPFTAIALATEYEEVSFEAEILSEEVPRPNGRAGPPHTRYFVDHPFNFDGPIAHLEWEEPWVCVLTPWAHSEPGAMWFRVTGPDPLVHFNPPPATRAGASGNEELSS